MHIKIISIGIIIFSILYGYTASRDFNKYLSYMTENEKLTELNMEDVRFKVVNCIAQCSFSSA